MKKLLLFIFCPFFLLSQEQVSDVYFDDVINLQYFNGYAGFVNIEEKNYVILNRDSLMIFTFENEELTLLHSITDRPAIDYQLTLLHKPHLSGLAIEGKNIFRFYRDRIQVIDILTGALEVNYDLDTTPYSMYQALKIYGDYFFFRGFGEGNQRLVFRFNWKTQELTVLPPFFVDLGYEMMINQKFYFNVPGENQIQSLDGLTGEVDTVLEYQSDITFFQRNLDQGREYITIGDQSDLYLIDEDFALIFFPCSNFSPQSIKTLHKRANKVFMSRWNPNFDVDVMSIFDIQTCDKIQEFQIEGVSEDQKVELYDYLSENFTLIAYPGDFYGNFGYTFMIDHDKQSFHVTEIGLRPLSGQVMVSSTSIYYIEYTSGDFLPPYYNLMKYDITTGTFKRILPYPNLSHTTVLGLLDSDELYFMADYDEYDPQIWKLTEDEELSAIAPMDFKSNHGVGERHDILVDDDKIISVGIGGMMITQDFTDHIHVGGLYSDLLVSETEYGCLMYRNDSLFVLSSDKFGLNTDLTFYKKHSFFSGNNIASNGLLFNFLSGDTHLYYDFNDREEKRLTFQGTEVSANRYVLGQDYIIMGKIEGIGVYSFYLFEKESQTLTRLENAPSRSRFIRTAKNNTFYFSNTDFMIDQTVIHRFHPQEGFTKIFEGDGEGVGWRDSVEEGKEPLMTVDLKLDNKVKIVSDNGNETHITEVEHDNPNFNTVVKNQKGEHHILQTEVQGENSTYYYRFGSEPILIPIGIEADLRASHIDGDIALLFYQLANTFSYQVYQYNMTTDEVSEIVQFGVGHGLSQYITTLESKSKYLFAYREENTGYEPWILDIESGSVVLLANIAREDDSGSPRNFTRAGEYVYFTSKLDDGSRQWFRIESSVVNGVDKFEVHPIGNINIFPNPTTAFIFLDRKYASIDIYNSLGDHVFSLQGYTSGEKIDVTRLPEGQYFLHLNDEEGITYSGKFFKTQ